MRLIDLSGFGLYEAWYKPAELLSRYSYSLCGGPCAGLFRIDSPEMLADLVARCIRENVPYKVLGGISNTLVSDSGFDGIVLLNRGGSIKHQIQPDGKILLQTGSGTNMANLVKYCETHGFSGFEWASGLPGTAGGAVYGNAGAFGTEIADVFNTCTLVDGKGNVREVNCRDMNYSYRSSILKEQKNGCVLLNASFLLSAGDKEKIIAKGEENKARRRSSQPYNEPSLGSVFRNPDGFAAGKLIEDAGLKGFRIGKAEVSRKHANFITTEKGVKSEDYFNVIVHVRKKVLDLFGIDLEPEIEFVGF